MATVRSIVEDAFMEIGVLAPGQSLSATLAALGLLRFQNQLDSWQADRLAMSIQTRTTFTLTSGTSTVTVGTGGDVSVSMPMWIDTVAYVNPASSPEVEVVIGQMTPDTYAALSIKELQSALPTQCFYQTSITDRLGELFFWPQVTQNVSIVLYHPESVGVPASLNSSIVAPPGYADAFMYELAMRLCGPTGTEVSDFLAEMVSKSRQTMQRPNVQPGLLGVDPATTNAQGAGYNVYSDQMQSSR